MTLRRTTPRLLAGFSLIELLVAMAIGLIVTLAVTSVLIRGEGSKRSTSSVNDISQTGAYATYVLDRFIRSAGSGYSQRWSDTYGCLLGVSQSTTQVLPIPTPLGATSAFTAITETDITRRLPIRLAPVVIGKNLANTTGGSAEIRGDLLMVMGGTAGVGESPQAISTVGTNQILLDTTLGYRTNDMLLISDGSVPAGCLIRQAVNHDDPLNSDQSLSLGGDYSAQDASNVTLAQFTGTSVAMQLGNAVNNFPQFQLFGVGANNTLESYDLLKALPAGGSDPDVPIADGVVEMRALYGVDGTDDASPTDGTLDRWVDPSGDYLAQTLLDGSPTGQSRLHRIVAVRVGLILRTSLAEHAPQTPTTRDVVNTETYQAAKGTKVTLFNDMKAADGTSLRYERTLTDAERSYRFRTVEITIPLRNVILAP
jgi:type IV pilus assembly protein PilW